MPCSASRSSHRPWGAIGGRAVLWFAVLWFLAMVGAASGQAVELRQETLLSDAVGRKVAVHILLPEDYARNGARHPVLYLLHGFGGDHHSWLDDGAADHASRHDLIVVMPDVGNSWYVDGSHPDHPNERWESFMIDELIPWIDGALATVPRREARAIAGRSMGGFGALVLGLRNSELFVSVGSSSGYLGRAREARQALERGLAARPRRLGDPVPQGGGGVSGGPFTSAQEAGDHDPFALVAALPVDSLPHVYLDCGTDDPLLRFSREMALVLLERNARFDFGQAPGGHDGTYWNHALGHLMAIQAEVMRRALLETAETLQSPGASAGLP